MIGRFCWYAIQRPQGAVYRISDTWDGYVGTPLPGLDREYRSEAAARNAATRMHRRLMDKWMKGDEEDYGA